MVRNTGSCNFISTDKPRLDEIWRENKNLFNLI